MIPLEQELGNRINVLDVTVTNSSNSLGIGIHNSKPPTSTKIIWTDLHYSLEHKQATVRYFLNRLWLYLINKVEKANEP